MNFDDIKNANGNHFEDLFSQLMKEKYGQRYQQTSTYGRKGDMSVDGVLDSNTAFAVYAPEIYSDEKALNKIQNDFNGFIKQRKNGNWTQITKYIFVIKRERRAATSSVIDLISKLGKELSTVSTEIITLDDINIMINGYLPFSQDGQLLEKFKNEILEIVECCIKTDFSAQPFKISLIDNIQELLERWNTRARSFNDTKLEALKNAILGNLSELIVYIIPPYTRVLSPGIAVFSNGSSEEGERLRNELRPNTIRIRNELNNFYNELFNIK